MLLLPRYTKTFESLVKEHYLMNRLLDKCFGSLGAIHFCKLYPKIKSHIISGAVLNIMMDLIRDDHYYNPFIKVESESFIILSEQIQTKGPRIRKRELKKS